MCVLMLAVELHITYCTYAVVNTQLGSKWIVDFIYIQHVKLALFSYLAGNM